MWWLTLGVNTTIQTSWVYTTHLDYSITAKAVAQSASRALGLLIARAKACGAFPFGTFTRLYDSTVNSVISYGASIWSTREYSCINVVQHRACRFFFDVGGYSQCSSRRRYGFDTTGIPSVELCHTCKTLGSLDGMDINRMNYKVYRWAESKKTKTKKKNGIFVFKSI